MLRLFADAFRHRGPVGGLFVLLMVALLGGALILPAIAASVEVAGALLFTCVVATTVALVRGTARRRRAVPDFDPIHRWPRLGQNDRWAVRSKLLQPAKRK